MEAVAGSIIGLYRLSEGITMPEKPHIVLVHGAWGDASHWRYVIPLLHKRGYRVFGVQNPLTSLPDDIDRTSKLLAEQGAPRY
jgi:pimeloyl-ACP methyl ester carboxylesterase